MTTAESTTPIRAMFVHEMSASTEIAEMSARHPAMIMRSLAKLRLTLHAMTKAASIGAYPRARTSGNVVPRPKSTTAETAKRAVATASQLSSFNCENSLVTARSVSTLHTVDEPGVSRTGSSGPEPIHR